ncbi:UNVERIFIED_CONTAM: AMP deaminase [Sesamum latifolium]|uniref:AMP deaminase n=1 Tax=Sesamum latifolium TaxID=2727402 RepID=A0AAW2UUQ1_9LAMI
MKTRRLIGTSLYGEVNKVLNSFDDHNEDKDGDKVRNYRVSSSLPNVSVSKNEWCSEGAGAPTRSAMSTSLREVDLISSDLPPIRTDQRDGEEQYMGHSGTSVRVGSAGRLVTPRSAGGYTFEGTGDSDDEETELPICEDHMLSYQNDINLTAQNQPIVATQTEKGIYVHVQESEAVLTEAKSNIDHADRKIDAAPANTAANDPVFNNNIFPPITPLHGFISDALQNMKSDSHFFRMEDGVVRVYASESDTEELFPVASSTRFFTDMHHLLKVMSIGNVRSACHHRLRFLEEKFRFHLLVNADREFVAQKSAPHRDFYNIRKVDTHVHHSACMNQKHLLRFIKSKLKKEPDEVVIYRDGQYLTLKEVFDSLDLTGYDLNVDLLDVHADKSTFHRFDKFNLKYNPCGQSRLREIFLKQDNLIQGRFLAEVTKQVLSDLEASKYQLAEYRISIYGRKQSEWDQLASWFVNNGIYSDNAVWLIQVKQAISGQ